MTNKIEEAVNSFIEAFAEGHSEDVDGVFTFIPDGKSRLAIDFFRQSLTSIYHAGKADKGEEVKEMVESLKKSVTVVIHRSEGDEKSSNYIFNEALDNVKELI